MKRLEKLNWRAILLTTIFTAFGSLLFISCEEDDAPDSVQIYSEVEDVTYANEVYNDVMDISDEAKDLYDSGLNSGLKNGGDHRYIRLGECVTITEVTTSESIVRTIDFGEEYCLCNDGRERKGKIIIYQEGHYWDGLVELTFTFENFFVDGNQITGEKSVSRTINEDGNRQSEIVVDGAIILADEGGTIVWHSDRTREIVEGSDTRTKVDDVVEVTGSSFGTKADGTTYTTEILTPLIKKHARECVHFFISGTMSIVVGEESEKIIDFGDGTCDNLATVTQDGVTETIELCKRRYRIH